MSPRPRAWPAPPLLQLGAVLGIAALAGAVVPGWEILLAALLVLVWPPAVGWRPLPVWRVLGVYAVFAVGWLVFLVIYLQVMYALGAPVAPQPILEQLARHGWALPNVALVLVVTVVVAPIAEEIVFRGYLFTALDVVLPRQAVHLLTALLFGLVHGAVYALPIGVLALMFGWLRARHAAMLPSILAHAVHNGLTVAVVMVWPGHLELLYPR